MRTWRMMISIVAVVLFCVVPAVIAVGARVDIPKYTIEEFEEKGFDLDGKTIKLEFRYRSEIKQIAKGVYSTNLWDKGRNNIYVEFGKDGFNWMKKVPERGGKDIHVYGKVKIAQLTNPYGVVSEGPVLVLLGRTLFTDIRRNHSFRW